MTATVRTIVINRGARLLTVVELFNAGSTPGEIQVEDKREVYVSDTSVEEGSYRELSIHKVDGTSELVRFTNMYGVLIQENAHKAFARDQFALLASRDIRRRERDEIVSLCTLRGVGQAVSLVDAALERYNGDFDDVEALLLWLSSPSRGIRAIEQRLQQMQLPTFTSGGDKVKNHILPGAMLYLRLHRRVRQSQEQQNRLWLVPAA